VIEIGQMPLDWSYFKLTERKRGPSKERQSEREDLQRKDRAKERTFKGKTDILIFRTDKLRIFNGENSHQLLILTAIDINIDFQNLFESMFNT
jgi:hypothetical protein